MVAWVTATVVLLNLSLYTAYDKQSKSLALPGLLDVLCLRKGVGHTLVELNKVAGLVGLTLLALAYAPLGGLWLGTDGSAQTALLSHALGVLMLHSIYSAIVYYGETHIPRLETWPAIVSELLSDKPKVFLIGVRKVSNLTASVSMCLLLWLVFGSGAPLASILAALATITLGTVHFYTMEVDFRLELCVRPFGFLPFYVAGIAELALAIRWLLEGSGLA